MGRVVKGRQAEANAVVPLPTRDGVAPSYLWLTETDRKSTRLNSSHWE